MESKIQSRHLEKPAYVYLRQSTMSQVRHHRESTERQYALQDRARALGWQKDQIRVLDGDLGLSGADSKAREAFKTLVADVSMGNVGAVFALEASRLSRSNTDWHRLLELCSLTGTLLIDEDGCYNPSDFNDQLLLGLKGTMSQAELHLIRARLLGGKRNKAKKGELRFPLPVGYVYDNAGKTVQDPDSEVRGSAALVFSAFRDTGTAYGVMQYFRSRGLLFPKRAYGGAWDGKLVWSGLSHSRVLGVLKNPSYAGIYSFGRHCFEKRLSPEGDIKKVLIRKSLDSCEVMIKDHHEGYIEWEEFKKNQAMLEKNRTNSEPLSSVAREGLTLLQGLLVCGKCGRHITIRYTGNGGMYPVYQCTRAKLDGHSPNYCLSVRSDDLDRAVEARVLAALEPHEVEIAIRAYSELEARAGLVDRQWQLKRERAQYEVDLAERRYEEVDPANRLVVSTLEQRWNEALVRLQQVDEEIAQRTKESSTAELLRHREAVLALTKNFPRLWHASTTNWKDRKKILRVLIRDITVERVDREMVLHIRWQGGRTEDIKVLVRARSWERWKHSPEIVTRVRHLATTMTDPEMVALFNQEGLTTNKGNGFTVGSVRWIRLKHGISAPALKEPQELTVDEVAARFGVTNHVVYYWIDRKLVKARKQNKGSPWWITIDAENQTNLEDWSQVTSKKEKSRRAQTSAAGGAV